MKARLVESQHRAGSRRSSAASSIVVGVNAFTESEPSPLTAGEDSILVPRPEAEAEQVERLKAWRAARDEGRCARRWRAERRGQRGAQHHGRPRSPAAKAGVTTGEWGDALRAEFGEYRAPTGVSPRRAPGSRATSTRCAREVERVSLKLGRRIKFLVGKPGLDGHSNGAEQIAVRATRRRHGGGLRGHPPDARREIVRGGQDGRALVGPVDPVGLPCRR